MRAILLSLLVLNLSWAKAQVAEKAEDICPLLVGEQVPKMKMKTSDVRWVETEIQFMKKRTVLLFYRGGWCPYCNAHLAAVGDMEKQILDMGFQIVAIAPDSPEELTKSRYKNKINYTLLSDEHGEYIKAMGLAFKAAERHKVKIRKYSDGKNPGILPVPALFVLDQDGVILFEHIDPQYKQRISTNMLMNVLKGLQ